MFKTTMYTPNEQGKARGMVSVSLNQTQIDASDYMTALKPTMIIVQFYKSGEVAWKVIE